MIVGEFRFMLLKHIYKLLVINLTQLMLFDELVHNIRIWTILLNLCLIVLYKHMSKIKTSHLRILYQLPLMIEILKMSYYRNQDDIFSL